MNAAPDPNDDQNVADLLATCEAKFGFYSARELKFLRDMDARAAARAPLSDGQLAWLTALAERVPLDFDAIRRTNSVASVAGAVMMLKKAGDELVGCCPFHADRTPSFYVFDAGKRWICFGKCGNGDVLDFAQRYYGVGLREAAEMICRGDLPTIEAPVLKARDRDNRYALAIWSAAVPIEGTPGEAYFRRRGITGALPPTLRFAYLKPPKDSGVAALTTTTRIPAVVALVTDAADQPAGIQRIYLGEAGCKAAAADGKVKFGLGRVRGGAIRLGPACDDLVVTEGLEDALSLMEMGAPSAWATAGTENLPAIGLPDQVRSIVIGGDADEPGQLAAEKAAAAITSTGRAVRIIYPDEGFHDFNDELMGVRV